MVDVFGPARASLILLASLALFAAPPDEDEDDEELMLESPADVPARMPAQMHHRMRPRMKAAPAPQMNFEADMVAPEMPAPSAAVESGATPGGVQDVNLLRALVNSGRVPPPDAVTPEGLFSEHDLPLRTHEPCTQLICVNPEVTDAKLTIDPDRHYLVQLGFASNLDLDAYERPPFNLVLAVDLSSSMQGQPLETTRASIEAVLRRLGPDDRVTLLAFREGVQPLVSMAAPDDGRLQQALYTMSPSGLSNLDVGLGTALEVGRRSQRGFSGRTRVVLFSDDRPTHGRPGAAPLLTQVQRAADDGVGLTTIGVGLRFDAELAQTVGSVRGGSVLFFDDYARMQQTFENDFESLFLELAHELEVVVEPAAGMRVTKIYGVPEDFVERQGRGIRFRVETVFSSKRKGAIYFALDPDGRPNLPRTPVRSGMELGQIRLTYREVGGARRFHDAKLETVHFEKASPGLVRGSALVDEWLAVDAAARHYAEGNAAAARAAIQKITARLDGDPDLALDPERETMHRLLSVLGG